MQGRSKGSRGEAALHGPRGKRGTGECVFFLVHPLHRDHGQALVTRQSMVALKVFPLLCASAIRTWNLVHYYRVPVSGSHCSARLGVVSEFENWNFREMPFFSWAQHMA